MCSGAVQLTPSAVSRPLPATSRTASSIGVPSLSAAPSRQQNVIHAATASYSPSSSTSAAASPIAGIVSNASTSGSAASSASTRGRWTAASCAGRTPP